MTDDNKSDYYQRQFDQAYRPSVGMVIFNDDGLIFVAERIDSRDAWQFPQGGIDGNESVEEAVFREMEEEIGTRNAEIIGIIDEWFYYDYPPHIVAKFDNQYRGQRQKWVALRFTGKDSDIKLDLHSTPEFKNWKWLEMHKVLKYVVPFKRQSYEKVIKEFSKYITTAKKS